MKELLLWIIGTQKIESLDSTLYCAIGDGDIIGDSAGQVLDSLLQFSTIEEAEKLATTSGGLRTVRALWIALQLLKNLENKEVIESFRQFEYPYNYLVTLGKKLDDAVELHEQIMGKNEEEEDEEIEDEDL
jgi:hypothetical protein